MLQSFWTDDRHDHAVDLIRLRIIFSIPKTSARFTVGVGVWEGGGVGVGGGLTVTSPHIFVICHPTCVRCQTPRILCPVWRGLAPARWKRPQLAFSFHRSSPQNPAAGFICVWTKTRRNIGQFCKLFINSETSGPQSCWPPRCWITCLFWKNALGGKWRNYYCTSLCFSEAAHTPLSHHMCAHNGYFIKCFLM